MKVEIEDKFVDNRGFIQNILNGKIIKGISLINSKAGTVRSNHYHKQDATAILI